MEVLPVVSCVGTHVHVSRWKRAHKCFLPARQVNWTAVAPEAELHLAVQLHAVWNAAVDTASAGNITALHLFGVRPCQCPPGTYRCAGRCRVLAAVILSHLSLAVLWLLLS